VIIYSRGTTDDVPRSTGSSICSDASAGASCGWGPDRGGEGTSCVRGTDWEGEDAIWIGDTRRGGEDGVVFSRFDWVLVLFGPFLLAGA